MSHTLSLRASGLIGLILTTGLLAGCPQSGQTGAGESSASPAASPADTASQAAPAADEGKGVGPVSSVELAAIDPALAKEGQTVFETKCSTCHKIDTKYVGPALQDVTQRRKPEWIMNMILNPSGMTKQDPTAKALYAKFMVQMADMGLEQKQARAILEYFRANDAKKAK